MSANKNSLPAFSSMTWRKIECNLHKQSEFLKLIVKFYTHYFFNLEVKKLFLFSSHVKCLILHQ